MEAYMTAKEAAVYLKLAERTLVRLAHEGKIPGVKIGGQWRFRRALLDDVLAGWSKQDQKRLAADLRRLADDFHTYLERLNP